MEKQVDSKSSSDTTNYPLVFVGAIIGATIGIIGWISLTYLGFFSIYALVGVGAFSGIGSRLGSRDGKPFVGLIAFLVGLLGIIIGDFIETGILLDNFNLTFNDYMSFMQYKVVESSYWRAFLYLGGLALSFAFGFEGKR